jgi:hypothetical protein
LGCKLSRWTSVLFPRQARPRRRTRPISATTTRLISTRVMNTSSKLGPHTQTDRGTCPGVGLCVYYKSRYTTVGGGVRRIGAQPFCCVLCPIFLPARIVHEVARAAELAKRRLRAAAPITPGSKSKSTAQGLVVKYADAAEVRVVVAAVLAAAADAVLITHHFPRTFEETACRQEARGKKRGVVEWRGAVKHTALCEQWQVNPRGDVPSASWNRKP